MSNKLISILKQYTLHIIFFFCFFQPLSAQENTSFFAKGFSLETTAHSGKIIRHSPKITYDLPDRSHGLSLNIMQQTYGKKAWHQRANYPRIGLLLHYYNFGDKAVLGSALGLASNISFKLFGNQKIYTEGRIGAGAFFLNRHYDILNNPTNNAAGSALNSVVYFELSALYRFAKKWQLKAGGSFTHTSNGASVLPNLGINIPAIAVGLRYTPHLLTTDDYLQKEFQKTPPKWSVQGMYRMTFRESIAPGGPKLPMYNAGLYGIWQPRPMMKFSLGSEYEFHRSTYQFSLHSYGSFTAQEARLAATRWSVFTSGEVLFGRIGLFLGFGYYTSKKSEGLIVPVYNRLGVRYYFNPILQEKIELNIGFALKSHLTVAEYFALGVGVRFLP